MKTYPYIGKSRASDTTVLFISRSNGVCLGVENAQYHNAWDESVFENITREYLANTYGKVESKEHAEFIVKLAESAGFRGAIASAEASWFRFTELKLWFYGCGSKARYDTVKQITLPLQPKEPESKEWPAVGDEVLTASKQPAKILAIDDGEAWIKYKNDPYPNMSYASVAIATLTKPPTPEEGLAQSIADSVSGGSVFGVHDLLAKAIINGEIKGLRYNPE